MRLFDRFTTLLKADAHGVIESLEERSLLLKQHLREAEIELNRKTAHLEAMRDDDKRLRDALACCDDEIRAIDEDVEMALRGGKDDLARFAIRRLLPRRQQATALRAQLDQREGEIRALAERVAAQQAQFDALRLRVRAELARAGAHGPASGPCRAELPVADEDVELELMRRRHATAETRP